MEEVQKETRFYTERQAALGTFLGGPLITGYLLSQNYKQLGEEETARKSIFIGTVCFILIAALLYFLPESFWDKVPSRVLPFINLLISAAVFRYYQKDRIDQLLQDGAKKESYWKTIGVGLLGTIISIAVLFPLLMTKPMVDGEVKEYGNGEHVIYYDKAIPVNTIDKIADVFIQTTFFENGRAVDVQVRSGNNSNTLYIILLVEKEFWENAGLINELKRLARLIEDALPGKHITFKLQLPDMSTGEMKEIK